MTQWILITMLCTRTCQPVYAEVYADKVSCMAQLKPVGTFEQKPAYCVPILVTKK